MVKWEVVERKFPHYMRLGDLPADQKQDERDYKTAKGFHTHSTTEDRLDQILKEGLKPRSETLCQIWGEERMPKAPLFSGKYPSSFYDLIRQCRGNSVYFWDDYEEAVGQGLASVAHVDKGEPVVLVINTKGMKLERDPELADSDPKEEPTSYMVKGTVSPKKIECVCRLDEDHTVSTGKLLCPSNRTQEDVAQLGECGFGEESNDDRWKPHTTFKLGETLQEELHNTENWECQCKKDHTGANVRPATTEG